MNLVDAVKSGKAFKRNSKERFFKFISANGWLAFSEEDLLADDWEIEEEKIEITKNDLYEAFSDAQYKSPAMEWDAVRDMVAKNLGFRSR